MTDDSLDIERLIPQRLPMRVAETIDRVDDVTIQTTSFVNESWPTFENGKVSAVMLIELIAQSAAALQGWKERHEKESGIGGLLVGIPDAKPHVASIALGTRLVCTVSYSHGAPNYRAFAGEVRDEHGALLFTCSIQAYRPDGLTVTGGST
jgi:predicted hotdog family 3-hydroxylacyl-ACP dehydratase